MKVKTIADLRYRIICANPDHRYHNYAISNKPKAVARVEELNANPPANPIISQAGCVPWRVECQAVTLWGDPDSIELALYGFARTLEGRML